MLQVGSCWIGMAARAVRPVSLKISQICMKVSRNSHVGAKAISLRPIDSEWRMSLDQKDVMIKLQSGFKLGYGQILRLFTRYAQCGTCRLACLAQ
jgi:hypothetical protein